MNKTVLITLLMVGMFLISGCAPQPPSYTTDISPKDASIDCFTDSSCQTTCAQHCASINMKYHISSARASKCCPMPTSSGGGITECGVLVNDCICGCI